MKIRNAVSSDEAFIRQVYLEAFGAEENELVAELASELLQEQSAPEVINLIAEDGADLLGHIALSPVFAKEDGSLVGYILAPLAVKPQNHNAGIGKQLVVRGIKEAAARGVAVILVYGDPNYYTRFGFNAEVAENYISPFELKYPTGWLALDLGKSRSACVSFICVNPLNKPKLW